LTGFGVHPPVVFHFHPRGEQPVQFHQRPGVIQPSGGEIFGGGVGDFGEELISHGAKKSFDLSASLRLSG